MAGIPQVHACPCPAAAAPPGASAAGHASVDVEARATLPRWAGKGAGLSGYGEVALERIALALGGLEEAEPGAERAAARSAAALI